MFLQQASYTPSFGGLGLRLMGEEVLPAVREMGKELELFSPFEVDPATGRPVEEPATTAA